MPRIRCTAHPFRYLTAWVWAAALAVAAPAAAQNPTWTEVGPVTIANGQNSNITAASSITGAVRDIIVQPGSSDIIYAATTNGGIWKTTNGSTASPTWTPLTDQLPSLSLAGLSFDPTDLMSNTLIAGFTSYSSAGQAGGPNAGVYRTTNGGTTWTPINGTGSTAPQTGRFLDAVLARNSLIVTSSFDFGICRSTDGGANYTRIVGGATGLPLLSTYTLVGDAAVSTTAGALFAGVGQGAASNTVLGGIYKSANGGATFTNTNSAAMQTVFNAGISNVRIALGPGTGGTQTVFAMVNDTTGNLAGLFRSPDGGTTWTALDTTISTTKLYNGNQGGLHASLVADPNNSNVVYLGGDRVGPSPFTAQMFRIDASKTAGTQGSLFVNSYNTNNSGVVVSSDTTDNSTPHADTRVMAFDSNGSIVLGGDGGIYRRTGTPMAGATIGAGTGTWNSIAGNLRSTELNAVAYDRVSKSLMASLQDNGTVIMKPGVSVNTPLATQSWTNIFGGDGGGAAIDPLTTGAGTLATNSVRYITFQNFGAAGRMTYNAGNNLVTGYTPLGLQVSNASNQALSAYLTANGDGFQFVTPLATNSVVGGRLYIGTRNRIFESTNNGDTVTDLSPGFAGLGSPVSAIRAGGTFNAATTPNVLYVGTNNVGMGTGSVYARSSTSAALSSVANLPGYGTATTNMPVQGLTMDTRDSHNVFVVGPNRVFAGAVDNALVSTWTNYTGNLATVATGVDGILSLTALEFVPFASVSTAGVLVAGSNHGAYFSLTSDATHSWTAFGTSFPNAYVTSFQYDVGDDVLVAALLGRGVYVLPNASMAFSPVPEPTLLLSVCGLAGIGYGGWRRRRRAA